jgi:hypothetical protein
MTLRGLPTAVCLLVALGTGTTVHAWTAEHDANICAAGGGGGGGGSGGGGGGSGGGGSGGGGGGGSGAGASAGNSGNAGSAGSAAATSVGVGTVGPATNSVAPTHHGGIATGIGAAIGSAGNGAAGGGVGVDAGGDPSGATSLQGAARPYSLRPIYFRRDQFKTTADCLTAAYGQGLPLEVCQ